MGHNSKSLRRQIIPLTPQTATYQLSPHIFSEHKKPKKVHSNDISGGNIYAKSAHTTKTRMNEEGREYQIFISTQSKYSYQ